MNTEQVLRVIQSCPETWFYARVKYTPSRFELQWIEADRKVRQTIEGVTFKYTENQFIGMYPLTVWVVASE